MVSKEYRQCSYCIMDTTDPQIEFDENGECNHCKEYRYYDKNLRLKGEAAQRKTAEIVSTMQKAGKGKDYDCIMGISGGVDSSYLAYYATKILGLRVLLVHVDTGWNSELAVKNIENIVRILNLDLHTLVIDWEEMRDLQRSMFLSSVPNCDIPQDHAFIASLYSEAKKYGIKHILNGGNMSTESILPKSWGYDASDWVHLKDIHRKFGKVKLKNYPHVGFFTKSVYYPYILKLKVYAPLEYIEYNKEETKNFLIDNLGWKDYGGKHFESKFTHFFQAHYLPTKFGFDKRLAHLSSLIVSSQISREKALEEMNLPLYDSISLDEDRTYFIKKLGFSEKEWQDIMNASPKSEDDYKNNKSVKKVFYKFLEVVKPIISVLKK